VAILAVIPIEPLRAVAGILLVLVLPGYAFAEAALATTRRDPATRLVVVVGASIVIAILAALVLDRTPWGIRREAWIGVLAALTTVGILYARRRSCPATTVTELSMPRLRPVATVVLIAAGGLVIGAFHVATTAARHETALTQVWLLPTRSKPGDPVVQVGVRATNPIVNAPGGVTGGGHVALKLRLQSSGQIIAAWRTLVVESGVAWHVQVHVPASLRDRELQAVLVRGRQERRASLWLPPR
jgi:hypothetical protein